MIKTLPRPILNLIHFTLGIRNKEYKIYKSFSLALKFVYVWDLCGGRNLYPKEIHLSDLVTT